MIHRAGRHVTTLPPFSKRIEYREPAILGELAFSLAPDTVRRLTARMQQAG